MVKITERLPIILAKNVEYIYQSGTLALKDINLGINKGELVAIMGKNGAGKTTLIRTFNGLIKPSKGNVIINGEKTSSKTIAELSKNVGIIFQNPMHQLFSNTIEDEIKFSLKNLELSEEDIQKRADAILETFNLKKYRKRSPLNLSGGETKKLAIAAIFCRDPDILVFDEPTLGQDAREITFFTNLIKKELDKGKTIIIVTHNIEFAMEHVPRTILMADGRIIADGPTRSVLNKEFLTKKTSLILPQITQFNQAMQKIGIQSS
ncbi:MAG: ABC transporter ATP-binding protein, partial [archaeon]|nr:ABC transporter ATP-binding protein [archaeon]